MGLNQSEWSAFDLLGCLNPRAGEFDRILHADLVLGVDANAAIVNQPFVLQGLEHAGHGFLAAIIVQHFLAQPLRVGMQQAGENF